MKPRWTFAAGGGQKSASERRGEQEAPRREDDERERQYREESLAVRHGYIRCGGGYLIRRKKLEGS